MTDTRVPAAEPQFSQPLRQIATMLVAVVVFASIAYIGFSTLLSIYWSNAYLNSLILVFFILGVLSCFGQVAQLMSSVRWIKEFVASRDATQAPPLLAPLATLMRSRGARMQINATSSRSILDSVSSRIEEDREITRYLANTLIFFGLLGTFYGLATTVPALVETIRSLNPEEGESGAAIFVRLQAGLETQLGGMGTAFSSSLLGLAGSLVIGFLELFAGHGQNRFYRELEEWLSSITRLGISSGDEVGSGDGNVFAAAVDQIAQQMEGLQDLFRRSEAARAEASDQVSDLSGALRQLTAHMQADQTPEALLRVAEGQDRLIAKLRDSGVDGIDAESRMRLRSIDVQLLRILEEMTAGRQETLSELRGDLSGLARAMRSGRLRPDARDKE